MRLASAAAALLLGLASTHPAAAAVTLAAGTQVDLVTAQQLSTKQQAKGDLVALRTAQDVRVGDRVVIPAGTPAVGQIVDARARGAMGMSGKLVVRPLYLTLGGRTIRLTGREARKPDLQPHTALGVLLFVGVQGREAVIAEGTALSAQVEKNVVLGE